MTPALLLVFFAMLATACATPDRANSAPRAGRRVQVPSNSVSQNDDIPSPLTDLGTYSVSRQISMFYKLDLERNNVHSPAMSQIMRIYEGPVRACYTERLDNNPALQGYVDLSFALTKASGGMQQIKHVGGSIKDPALVHCLKRRIAEIPFHPPQDMQGHLRYQFNVNTSQSAARAMPARHDGR